MKLYILSAILFIAALVTHYIYASITCFFVGAGVSSLLTSFILEYKENQKEYRQTIDSIERLSKPSKQKLLQQALEEENYELAAKLRDEINGAQPSKIKQVLIKHNKI